jgi:hypothetical protein
MKLPPLLLGAALLFWGWQSDLLPVGALLAVILESARVVHRRWEFSDEDLARAWTLCALLFLGSAIYAFTANDVPAAFSGYLDNPSFANQRRAGGASARTAAAMFRWLPMIFFPFMAACVFSARETTPLSNISLILRRRLRRAAAAGRPLPRTRQFHVGYAYLVATLLAASVHPGVDNTFFWGLAGLLAWTLWTLRSRRFHLAVWSVTLAVAIGLGFAGQEGIGQLQAYVEKLNPAWLQRFLQRGTDATRSRTAIGSIGRLKLSGKIVIRLRVPEGQSPPDYLREASYRSYRLGTWFASGRRENFEGNITEEYPNSRSWNLLSVRRSNSVAQISCGLPGGNALLPLPTGTWRLENLAAYVLRKNELGAVQCEGPGLVVFDAHYGPGELLDSDPIGEDRLGIPAEEQPALAQVAKELGLGSDRPARDVMERLQRHFTDRFTYSTYLENARLTRTNQLTPLGRFLLETRSGHCEYFASATVLLLRYANIPARYVVGYYVHEGKDRRYVVRQRDAHAWCVVWDEAIQQWVNFDTTPASWIQEEADRRSVFEWLGDAWTRFTFEIARLRWGQNELREYLFLLIVPGLLVLAYQIFFRRRKRRLGDLADARTRAWPGLDSEFYRLESALADRGLPRPPNESLADWLERATRAPEFTPLRPGLQQLLQLHYRYRFDPAGLGEAEREQLRAEARQCLEVLAQLEPPAAGR